MDTHETIEIIEIEPGKRHQESRKYLGSELRLRAKTNQIVNQSHTIDERQADEEIERPQTECYLAVARIVVKGKHDANEGEKHAGQKGDASQSGDGCLMHLTGVGNVVYILLLAEVHDNGNKKEPAKRTHQNG
jgi:hypothetical protein